MAKRSKKAWKEWLDFLAKIIVKTRDDFQCQIVHSPACAGTMEPLDFNCQWVHIKSKRSNKMRWILLNAVCGCGSCHAWAHDNPDEFGKWFAAKYPHREKWINKINKEPNKTWRDEDYKKVELYLLEKAIDLNVDYINIPKRYRDRFKRMTEELRMEL